ncbi:hypothetical protein EVAR_54126_1 [Eumeta japonica]|uniref:Uncharacterized protein n=1 Tax=Eumeta variegata TaxID=151549 RepID=A0A4C1Z1P6_EUMVA|nr:hypothetical protein EVAR_54126_1 [Eumeta japonica]
MTHRSPRLCVILCSRRWNTAHYTIYHDCSRRMAKNIKRLCDVRYRKFRACGLFSVDAMLPLRLTERITTYCVVLLQFAFL